MLPNTNVFQFKKPFLIQFSAVIEPNEPIKRKDDMPSP